jgi:hypothetical protein
MRATCNGELEGSRRRPTRTDDPQVVGRRFWGAANRTTWLFEVRRRPRGNEGARRAFEEKRRRGNGAAVMAMAKRQGRDGAWLLKSSRMGQGQSRWLELKSRADAGHMVRAEAHTRDTHGARAGSRSEI